MSVKKFADENTLRQNIEETKQYVDNHGGHKIIDSNGTQMTQRGKIQFNNATVADDSTNNKTIVTIPKGLQLGTTSTTALKGDTKYAGSSSAGGAATSADKLNTNAGNTTTPVYFANGIPKALGYSLAKSVPSDAKFTDTDTKVTQTASTTNANYRVLMSATADDTTRTETSVKSSKIYGNPNTGNLQVTQLNGVTVGTSPKFTDTTYGAVTSSANGLAISTDKAKFDAMAFISYGTCTTAAGTQAKVATLTNSNWSLKVGSLVGIKFTNTNTFNATSSAKITLDVNNTGAKPIYGYGTTTNTGTNTTLYGRANYINYYMYDGTNWVWAGSSGDNNTTYNIQNEAGTTMTHRTKIQFVGATVSDDSTNNKTVIRQTQIVNTEAEWNQMLTNDEVDPNVTYYLPWMSSTEYAADRTPIGTVISVTTAKTGEISGITTPTGEFPSSDYLVCDGAVKQIADYPKLADWFLERYGSKNYFGGNGTTTFAVPNFSADFPTNGILSIKAQMTSTQVTYAEVNDSLTTENNVWSAEKIYETIQILIKDTQYVSGLRYKNLGSQPTSEQLAKIASGDFTDFWNGDYWTYGGKNYRIVDNTDYYLSKGDTAFSKHGLIIMRDDNTLKADGSTTKYMKDTNDTTGGLKATKWWTTYRSQVKSTYDAWCGSSHIGQFRDLITNAVANGHASGWEWTNCTVQLPGEVQIYGSQIWGVGQDMNVNNGGLSGYNTGIAYPQFALFRLAPRWITNRENYWLKDIGSPSYFAHVNAYGHATCSRASDTWLGLRPLFILV